MFAFQRDGTARSSVAMPGRAPPEAPRAALSSYAVLASLPTRPAQGKHPSAFHSAGG